MNCLYCFRTYNCWNWIVVCNGIFMARSDGYHISCIRPDWLIITLSLTHAFHIHSGVKQYLGRQLMAFWGKSFRHIAISARRLLMQNEFANSSQINMMICLGGLHLNVYVYVYSFNIFVFTYISMHHELISCKSYSRI